ncbi:MAG: hypothetical protein V4538_16345 [Bacteroidota bacterium]
MKTPEFRIVQYPDKNSPCGKVFFVDKKIKKKILWLFSYSTWETVKGLKSGNSLFWFDLKLCMHAVSTFKNAA